jgi:hypothetical protein
MGLSLIVSTLSGGLSVAKLHCMKRPINLRPELWSLILQSSNKLGVNPVHPKYPGRRAYEAGVIENPELLADTVIELEDECEYVIDRAAAEALRNQSDPITVKRLGDDKEKTVPKVTLIESIRSGPVFDQLPEDR